MKKLAALVLLMGTAALGQGRPTLVDSPIDVKTAVSDAVIAELQDDLRQQLARNPGILVPTKSNWKAAVAALKRNDCEVRNECLQQLAVSAGVLYAMYLSLEKNTAGDVTATGRVVNQDGVLVRPPESVKVVKKGAFQDDARAAMTQLLTKLKLEALSPVLVKAPEEAKGKETIVVMRDQNAGAGGLRTAGFVTGALAVASAAVCAGFGISAMTTRGTLPANGHFTEEQARAQTSVNQGATIALGTGIGAAALGATAIILFATSGPSSNASMTVAPGPGGATLLLSGKF